jgi:Na+/proline symporter
VVVRPPAETRAGFFLGGKRIAWWAAGISFFATGASSIIFMALPARMF